HDGGKVLRTRSYPGKLSLSQRPPGSAVVGHILLAEPGAHLRAAARRNEIALLGSEPVATGRFVPPGDDLDDLAVLQSVRQRHDAAVHLRAPAPVTERSVHVVGEVQGRGCPRKIHDLPLGGEGVDAILEQLGAHALEKIAVRGRPVRIGCLRRLQQAANPLDLALVLRIARAAFLVGPMRGHAKLGVLVHFPGTALHFHAPTARPDHRCVDRTIEVTFGSGDVVIELARDVRPQAVDHTQGRVTLWYRADHHTHGAHVEELLERHLLALHLPEDAVHVLGTSIDLRDDTGIAQLRAQAPTKTLDIPLAIGPPLIESAGDGAVFL